MVKSQGGYKLKSAIYVRHFVKIKKNENNLYSHYVQGVKDMIVNQLVSYRVSSMRNSFKSSILEAEMRSVMEVLDKL